MNIICILSGGVGNRFGDDIPKQYHLANGRPIIDYTVRAALGCKNADRVVIVANEEYMEKLRDEYGVVTITGGSDRNQSLRNAILFIDEHYKCKNLMVIDAVCQLVTSELMNRYFDYAKEYDIVVTAAKVPTSIGCYYMKRVDREDYYMIQSPDVFDFKMLRDNFDPKSKLSTPIHQMPDGARMKLSFEFTNYAKVIYPHDIAVIEALLNERERRQ